MGFAAFHPAFCTISPRVLHHLALRFAGVSIAFCCILQCVLVLNAIHLQSFKPNIHNVSSPKLGQFFFKKKGKSIVNCKKWGEQVRKTHRPFRLFATFYIRFERIVCLDVAATKTCFVKYFYHLNDSLIDFSHKKAHPMHPRKGAGMGQ